MLIIKTFKPIITSNTLQLFNQNTHRPFTTKPPLNNMPLIDPVTTGAGGDKTQEWQAKLVGKKLGEASDEVTFAKAELPKETRVIEPGSMVTKDFNPDRLNVHVGEDGKVTHVDHQ